MEETIVYKKEKSISYDSETGELHFHKLIYKVEEVADALTIVKVKNTMQEAKEVSENE